MSAGEVIKSEPIYRGKVIEVAVETVELPNGRQAVLEMVHHPGGAAIVALDDQERVCLLRQYRHAAGGWIWELPAGRCEPDETPLTTAQRELGEEAGLMAAEWIELGPMYSSPGIFTEVIHLWLARGLSEAAHAHEPGEVIEIHRLPLSQALDWCDDGIIADSKTLIGLYRTAAYLRDRAEFLSEGAGC
ncbi:NUDIX hydrolase [Caldichromatium japonicum]|uniref:GDP-mannose pyrophosphatase n=1 Tax=Caldichromatium japonicum TaxID=2699430 RepID=A0A6G7VBJ9_9GAMM|nr:NUDIX hydrolase [Caldichromatium japonicum]QIK37391.1 NUDIX hydrolase [Caldichromatium japonicum]